MSKQKIEMEIMNWDTREPFNSTPVITAKIDTARVTLMIDTGASISFLDKKFVEKHPILVHAIEKGKIDYHANMLGGVSKSANLVRTKNLTLGRKKFEHEFKVIDLNIATDNKELVYHGILGFDFIMQHQVELNFSDFSFAI